MAAYGFRSGRTLAFCTRGRPPEPSPRRIRCDMVSSMTRQCRTPIDLKGFANQRERPVDVVIRAAIAKYRHDIQARHYCEGHAARDRLI